MKQTIVILWAIVVLAGMSVLARYRWTAGEFNPGVPVTWPNDSKFVRDPTRATLVMAIHAQCPCSRASLHELAELMSRGDGKLNADIAFVDFDSQKGNWTRNELWAAANAIPGVTVLADPGGGEAGKFSAAVSGQVALYDRQGILIFSGGITPGRGHDGDSAGAAAILSSLWVEKAQFAATPIYGCPLGNVGKPAPNLCRK